MNRVDNNRIDTLLTDRFGVEFKCQSTNQEVMDIRPVELQRGSGFVIRVTKGWRSISAEFIADNFSASLIRALGNADEQKKQLFRSIASTAGADDLIFKVNDNSIDLSEPSSWPSNWNRLHLKLTRMPVLNEELTVSQFQELIEDVAGKLTALIVCLLPLEESFEESNLGLPEGSVSKVEVNRYERSTLNREACILIHGSECKVCDFNFTDFYGDLGRGYIHVHHVTPVSQLGVDYIVNPKTDLVPLCPNCHAMVHKRNPPYNVDELREFIAAKKISIVQQL